MNPTATIKCECRGPDGGAEIKRTINLFEAAEYQQVIADIIFSKIDQDATTEITFWGILEYTQAEWLCERNIFTILGERKREYWQYQIRAILKWFALEVKILEMLHASDGYGYHKYPPQSHPYKNEPRDWGK